MVDLDVDLNVDFFVMNHKTNYSLMKYQWSFFG